MFSYQNVTVILSSKTEPSDPIYARPPPTFLFLPSSIVKKQTRQIPVKNPTHPTLKSGNKSAIQPISKDFSRAKGFVASSAAALVSERMYRFASPSSQQPCSEKSRKIARALKNRDLFRYDADNPVFRPPDYPHWALLQGRSVRFRAWLSHAYTCSRPYACACRANSIFRCSKKARFGR